MTNIVLTKDNITFLLEEINLVDHLQRRSQQNTYVLFCCAQDIIAKMIEGFAECFYYVDSNNNNVFIHISGNQSAIYAVDLQYFNQHFLLLFDNHRILKSNKKRSSVINWRKEGF